jgi:hypothetical protein
MLPEFNSKIIRLKTNSLITQRARSARELDVFNHFIFDDSWALREAINSKQLHVKAVLDTIRKTSKFKAWLDDLPSDANLIREYVEKIEEKSPLERLSLKSIRFYFVAGLSALFSALPPEIGIPANIAASAFDSFLLDKLGETWKPSQFIEKDLRPLVKGATPNKEEF